MAGKWLLRAPDPPKYWFDNFDRPDENPAVGWQLNTGLGPGSIVSGALTSGAGNLLQPYHPGKVSGDTPTLLFSSSQYSRAYLATVTNSGIGASGLGPCVRILGGDAIPYGYDLAVGLVQTELYSPTVLVGTFEAGVAGDVWELQVWGAPSATWLRVIRNWRIVGTVIDNVSAASVVPRTGLPGLYSAPAAGTFARWEGGELTGDMVPWFSRTPTYMPVLQKALRRMPLKRRQQFLRALILAVPQVGADLTQSGVSRLIRSQDDELVLLAIIKKFLEVNG